MTPPPLPFADKPTCSRRSAVQIALQLKNSIVSEPSSIRHFSVLPTYLMHGGRCNSLVKSRRIESAATRHVIPRSRHCGVPRLGRQRFPRRNPATQTSRAAGGIPYLRYGGDLNSEICKKAAAMSSHSPSTARVPPCALLTLQTSSQLHPARFWGQTT